MRPTCSQICQACSYLYPLNIGVLNAGNPMQTEPWAMNWRAREHVPFLKPLQRRHCRSSQFKHAGCNRVKHQDKSLSRHGASTVMWHAREYVCIQNHVHHRGDCSTCRRSASLVRRTPSWRLFNSMQMSALPVSNVGTMSIVGPLLCTHNIEACRMIPLA